MFSVILPVYNGERYIDDAVESALKQRERDWELIIINDGSTDGTGRALEKYKSLPQIKIIAQKNLGYLFKNSFKLSCLRTISILFYLYF